MNLQNWINRVAGAFNRTTAAVSLSRQPRRAAASRPAGRAMLAALAAVALAATFTAAAQTNYYVAHGTEYAVIGSLPGDQMFPDVALGTNGGFVVWQDNATDGSGWGLSARRLDGTLSGTLGTFRVNAQGTNGQQNPRVALLKNGGAAFVWQGGQQGYQHIFGRFLTPTNTWLTTTDLLVSSFPNDFQVNPAATVLSNGNVVVVWNSFNQAGANTLLDVYAKILSPTGATVKDEFLVNQTTNYNQRSATVTALAGGGFLVAWVSEQQRLVAPVLGTPNTTLYTTDSTAVPSVDIYARRFQSDGTAAGGEFLVNQSFYPCANPSVAAAADGSFMVAWSGRDLVTVSNGWDIYARAFPTNGAGSGAAVVNTFTARNQYAPRLVSIGLDYLVVWTSLGQDGSREGVYGQFIHSDGTPTGGEFRVNTTTASQQMQPVVASDGVSQFLAVWTTYTGSPYNFDLYAQRYLNVDGMLQAMPAPFVSAPFTLINNVYQPQLQVSWAPLLGISVSNYLLYVESAATPTVTTTSNVWIMTAANGLTTNSTHSFQVAYQRTDGRVSPLSPAASGTTWGGQSWGGIPFEWMQTYYQSLNVVFAANGPTYNWPFPNAPLTPGGLTLLNVFQSGGNPLDASTWLRTALVRTGQGFFLNWNTQPGFTYQVQTKSDIAAGSWQNVGTPRFAAGTNDSIFVGASSAGYYQVYLVR